MIVYISGPITGVPDFADAFEREQKRLEAAGHAVINPCHAFCGTDGLSQEQYMRFHIHSILTADAVSLLPGWSNSKGATFERHMAEVLGLPIFEIGLPDYAKEE